MSDFITMQCPNCGGNLAIGNNALSLKCEHCGVEHMIRREAGGVILESYARCPVCNRNDKAEKVTAILRSQTQNSEGVTYQTQTVMVQSGNGFRPVSKQVEVPVKTSQMSELAEHLALPARPQYDRPADVKVGSSHFALIAAILTALFAATACLCTLGGVISAFDSSSGDKTGAIGGVIVLALITCAAIGGSVLLWVRAVPRQRKSNAENKALAEAKQREIQEDSAGREKQWQVAIDRWNKLYYCGRDDCVFLPGTNTCAPVTEMAAYIFKP